MKTIEEYLNRDFSILIDWFLDNKPSVNFGDKTKSILFSPKHRSKAIEQIDISYKAVNIKQYSKLTYLGCTSDEYLALKSMAIQVCTKITSKLNFLYRKSRFLWKVLRRFLCNALIQPHFDYAFAAWYPNLNQKYRNKLHVSQNKCIRFCLQLDNRGHIGDCTKNEVFH